MIAALLLRTHDAEPPESRAAPVTGAPGWQIATRSRCLAIAAATTLAGGTVRSHEKGEWQAQLPEAVLTVTALRRRRRSAAVPSQRPALSWRFHPVVLRAEEIRGKIRAARRQWAGETPERPQRFAGAQFYGRLIFASAEWS